MLLFHTKTDIYIDRENISTNTATTNVILGAETAGVLNVDKPLVNQAFYLRCNFLNPHLCLVSVSRMDSEE